jgi:hypothetical protein
MKDKLVVIWKPNALIQFSKQWWTYYHDWWNFKNEVTWTKHNNHCQSDSPSAVQETSRFLWDPEVDYCVHKSPPLDIIRR